MLHLKGREKKTRNLIKFHTLLNHKVSPVFAYYLTSADGNLYAGVHIDFMSTDATLFRTMGGRTAIRTEQYDSRWLNGE